MDRTFLSKWELVSQAWLAPSVLAIMLSIIKLGLFVSSLEHSLLGLRNSAETLCENTNDYWNNLTNIPNRIEMAVKATVAVFMSYIVVLLKQLLALIISVLISVISFIVEIYLGTLTCLCTALVKGAVECVAEVLRLLTEALQLAVNSVLKEFNSAMGKFSDIINSALLGVNAVKSLFGSSGQNPSSSLLTAVQNVNLTISSLKNVSIPTSYIDKIEAFADEIPSFESVLSNVTSLLTLPLHVLELEIKNALVNFSLISKNNTSKSIIASKDAYLPFCHALDVVYADALNVTSTAQKVVIVVLAITAFLLAVISVALEYSRASKRATLFRNLALEREPIYIGNKIEEYKLGFWNKLFTRLLPYQKWIVAFAFSRNLLNCLLIAGIGYLSVGLQYAILMTAKKELKQLKGIFSGYTSAPAFHFVDDVQNSIDGLVDELNNALFFSVKKASLDLLSNMLTFQTETNKTLSSVFEGTPFAAPIRVIVYCTLGRKIEEVEDGLKWIITNLAIPTPQLRSEIKTLIEPGDLTTDSGAIQKRLSQLSAHLYDNYNRTEKRFLKALTVELIVCSAFVGIWLLYAAVGAILLWNKRQHSDVVQQEISWPKRFDILNMPSHYPYLDRLPSSKYSLSEKS